jgi:CRISPR-associated protein Cas8b1/Cst1 subtype I-B
MTKEPLAYKFDLALLVDDNDIDNFINERMITTSGFAKNVVVKNSAQGALEYLSSILSKGEALPKVIFLDLNMPVMDGFAFLEQYENFNDELKAHCKIIVLSSSISPEDINRASTNPHVQKFLNKPLSEKYLNAVNF